VRDGVTFHAIPPATGSKWGRAWQRVVNTYRVARALEAPLYHLHDPELIPAGLRLHRQGAKVVYDVHEDAVVEARTQLRARPLDAHILSNTWRLYEAVARRTLDGFVAVTDDIAAKFPADRRVVVTNYPVLEEFAAVEAAPGGEPGRLVHAGMVSRVRGLFEMLEALARLPADVPIRVDLIGSFFPPAVQAEAERHPGWARVRFGGWVGRQEAVRHLAAAQAGLVFFHPERDHLTAQPNKLFEYMAAGLPVIASNFPAWRTVIEGGRCGLAVDPLDPAAIAAAMRWMYEHPEEARAMGANGRRLVRERYNWDVEAAKLLAFYRQLLRMPNGE
jgi:glycosyltransferase involved in cell wall biosynthesis